MLILGAGVARVLSCCCTVTVPAAMRSMLSSSSLLGRLTRRIGLFIIPEERQRPEVLEYFNTAMHESGQRTDNACDALRSPYAHALHTALLPNEVLGRRQLHYLQGLLYKVTEDGLASLSTDELRDVFSHAASLSEIHSWIWTKDQHVPL